MASPALMPAIRAALSVCEDDYGPFLSAVGQFAANEGLGYRILKFSRFLQTPKIFVYLIVLGVIGLAFDFLFRRFNATVFHWADTTKR